MAATFELEGSVPPPKRGRVGLGSEPLEPKHRTYFLVFAIVVVAIAMGPYFYGLLATPSGGQYLGVQYNTDDHMVYAAWMWQSLNGSFFFDNRFAVDSQPGLTVHLYYLLLGKIASVTGIAGASALARAVFSLLFFWLALRLIRRVAPDVYTTKLAMALVVFGGGLGFLVWHSFGIALVRPGSQFLSPLTGGLLPTDVWQPEGFVFPSMLTNGLFMVSLCLMLGVVLSVLDSRDSWRPVLPGFLCMGLLMNIHSYDVLLLTLVLVAFLAMQLAVKEATGAWILRAVLIGLGAVPAALWFVHVLQSDAVFQARAATETYAPNFRPVVFGYLPLLILGFVGMARVEADSAPRRMIGVGLAAASLATLYVLAFQHAQGYFLGPLGWGVAFVAIVAALVLLARREAPELNFLMAWSLVGLIAIYFPALFQRKLAMGMSVPWAILAGLGFAFLAVRMERSQRNLLTVLVLLVFTATSVRWIFREVEFANRNVANTTVHPVFLNQNAREILAYLNQGEKSRRIVVAMPGVAASVLTEEGQPVVDAFASPIIPDLNPILSGLAGVYAYAGHWSETPDYGRRRGNASRIFLKQTDPAAREALLEEIRPDYVVAPVPETYGVDQFEDLRGLGETVVDGPQFRLIRVRR